MFNASNENIIPPAATRFDMGNTTGFEPQLVLTLMPLGAQVKMLLDSGHWLNCTAHASIEEYNLTYDRWRFDIQTVPNTANVTIIKGDSNWSAIGFSPYCNYTETNQYFNLTDVYDSIVYSVWFTVPKVSPYSVVTISLFNAFTGQGFFFEQWKVMYCQGATWVNTSASTLSVSTFKAEPETYYTIAVLDYFNNVVATESLYTSAKEIYLSIPLSVYSYRFYDGTDQFVKLWIWYNVSAPPYTEYISPRETSEHFLIAGNYRFAMTTYSDSGITGVTRTWLRTVADAGYVIYSGATIQEVLTTAQGVQATQEVITDILTPDIVWVGNNMPGVPAWIGFTNNMTVVDNRYVLEATSHQTGSGTWLYFNSSEPMRYTSLTLLNDYFYFTGNVSTALRINYTSNATMVYSVNILSSSISLSGGSYTIWSNRTISVTRDLSWRVTNAFSYNYYTDTDYYKAEISVNNPTGVQWRNLYMFVPYLNGSYADNRSVKVFDMNNSLYLVEGSQYVLSKTGYHLWFSTFANNTLRGFQFSYTMVNDSWVPPIVQITVTTVGNGVNTTVIWHTMTYWYCDVSWTNSYRETYDNAFYMKMACNPYPDMSSIVILTDTGFMITNAIISGDTIMIPNVRVPVGAAIHYRILFQSAPLDQGLALTFGGISIYVLLGIIALTCALSAILLIWSGDTANLKSMERKDTFGKIFLFLAVITTIGIVLLSLLQTISGG
jgi:hypothetical protein